MIFPFVGRLGRYCTVVSGVIEYPIALDRLKKNGMVCNYFNGGAFGFAKGVEVKVLGWTAGEDATIRPELRSRIRQIAPPAEENMAKAAVSVWQKELAGPAWIMPLSHWAFELDFGSKSWMPRLIQSVGVDPQLLQARSDASPIEFGRPDPAQVLNFVQTLLENLTSSDFMLAFPTQPALCTIHHHKQLWWTSSDETVIERISGHSLPLLTP